jgi:hypothetical protein
MAVLADDDVVVHGDAERDGCARRYRIFSK